MLILLLLLLSRRIITGIWNSFHAPFIEVSPTQSFFRRFLYPNMYALSIHWIASINPQLNSSTSRQPWHERRVVYPDHVPAAVLLL